MELIDKIFVSTVIVLGTMGFVKNICKMNCFKNWGLTKHVVFVGCLVVFSFYLKYFFMCYAGIDEQVIWIRAMSSQFLFPRYLLTFAIVNLLLPGMFILFFQAIEGDEPFLGCFFGAASCITLAGVFWHFIYMYPNIDESIAFFSAVTIAIMILYGYQLAVKRQMIKTRQKSAEIVFLLVATVLFLSIAIRYVSPVLGEFRVWSTFRAMGCGNFKSWLYVISTILYMVVMWKLWNRCETFSTRVFSLAAVLMPTLRWGYAILMNFGILPTLEYFVGIPYSDRYIVYDLMCLGVLLTCFIWKAGKGKMLLVKTPVDKVKMGIEEEVLERIIEERVCENENAKKQIKRFFWSAAIESIEGDVLRWISCISFLYVNRLLEPVEDEGDVIVASVKEQEERIYLISENEDALKKAETWLEKFLGRENLTYSQYVMPRNLFLYDEEPQLENVRSGFERSNE